MAYCSAREPITARAAAAVAAVVAVALLTLGSRVAAAAPGLSPLVRALQTLEPCSASQAQTMADLAAPCFSCTTDSTAGSRSCAGCCPIKIPSPEQRAWCRPGGCCVRALPFFDDNLVLLVSDGFINSKPSSSTNSNLCGPNVGQNEASCPVCATAVQVSGRDAGGPGNIVSCPTTFEVPDPSSPATSSAICTGGTKPTSDASKPGKNNSGSSNKTESPSATPSVDEAPASPAPTQKASNGSTCFPAHATVRRRDGVVIRMDALRIGDRVIVGPNGETSTVFMFTHRDPNAWERFIVLHTADGRDLQVTPGHYIYLNGRLAPAAAAHVGDLMQSIAIDIDGSTGADQQMDVPIVSVKYMTLSGVYNPQTLHGDIAVDGFIASTYTTALRPELAHAMLAPFRWVYGRIGVAITSFDHGVQCVLPDVLSSSFGGVNALCVVH